MKLGAVAKREPAVAIGLAASVVVAVANFLATGGHLTWAAVLPIIVGALIRPTVTPAAKP